MRGRLPQLLTGGVSCLLAGQIRRSVGAVMIIFRHLLPKLAPVTTGYTTTDDRRQGAIRSNNIVVYVVYSNRRLLTT